MTPIVVQYLRSVRNFSLLPFVATVLASALLLLVPAHAQPAAAVAKQPAAAISSAASATWASLSAAQKTALAPLTNSWESLSEGQKRKWIAVAKGYPGLAPTAQEKMHSRMVEWAAMSPKDRELARLNFAQTKTVPKSDRAAEWEAYQALSAEEKQKLAASGTQKPVGAAVAPKPSPADKLAAVPLTRRTPEEQRSAVKAAQTPAPKKLEGGGSPGAEAPTAPKS